MQRKQHSPQFKAKVAIEAIRGLKTVNELNSEYNIHPSQINQWKKQAVEELPELFASRRTQKQAEPEELTASPYQQIGQLKVELDWLKKNLPILGEPSRSKSPIFGGFRGQDLYHLQTYLVLKHLPS